jgi:hypothetical protein
MAHAEAADEHAAVYARYQKYKAFVLDMVRLTAGGPRGTPAEALCAAIEDGTVNMEAVHALLSGFPFESYTEPPKCWPPS